MAEIDEIADERDATEWAALGRQARWLGFVALGAWVLVVVAFVAAKVTPPPLTAEAIWFDKRGSIKVIVLITAIVTTFLWADRRAFGPLGSRGGTGRAITFGIATVWACVLAGSALAVTGPVIAVFAIPGVIAFFMALGATVEAGSLRTIPAVMAGNWLGAGGGAVVVLINFIVNPPATATICFGGMDCFGSGGPNESIAFLCALFALCSAAFTAVQLLGSAAGAIFRAPGRRGRRA